MPDDTTPPWYEPLSPEEKAHVTARGYDKMTPAEAAVAAARGHYSATKLIGVSEDQILRLPKDTTDPAFQTAYDRIAGMALPKDPSEYKFDDVKFKDGTALDEEDAAFVRDLAVKHKLPVVVAKGVAAALVDRVEAAEASAAQMGSATVGANAAALRGVWGGEFDAKSYAAMRAIEAVGFPKEVLEFMATMPTNKYIEAMNASVSLGAKMGEAQFHAGGGARPRDNTIGMSPQEATDRWSAITADPALTKRFLAGDAELVSEFKKLTEIMASARVPRQ